MLDPNAICDAREEERLFFCIREVLFIAGDAHRDRIA
jgi:hypothetical protein